MPVDSAGADGGDASPVDGSPPNLCNVTATATPYTGPLRVTAFGSVTCTGVATIAVEACLEWKPSPADPFVSLGCISSSQSGVDYNESEYTKSCEAASGATFRAVVRASVDATLLPEVTSSEVLCP